MVPVFAFAVWFVVSVCFWHGGCQEKRLLAMLRVGTVFT